MKYQIARALLPLALLGCNQADQTLDPEKVLGPAPGKWSLAVEIAGHSAASRTTCLKEQATLASVAEQPARPGYTCTAPVARKDGGDIVMESACSRKDTTSITADVRITGDLKSAYTMTIVTTTRPAPPPPPTPAPEPEVHQIKITGQRTGDC
jgi:hypothetical protein